MVPPSFRQAPNHLLLTARAILSERWMHSVFVEIVNDTV